MGISWRRELVSGVLGRRLNRFVVEATVDGEPVRAHLANSGRLTELLVPGREAHFLPVHGKKRATDHDLVLVNAGGVLVSVDARLPRTVVSDAVERGALTPFAGWEVVRHEPRFAAGRLDLELGYPPAVRQRRALIETKSVTLVDSGRRGSPEGRFPDAPTERGRRHLEELKAAVGMGFRAAVVFVITRNDARSFAPNWNRDPGFCRTLVAASQEGVEVYAYRCRVDHGGIELGSRVPVDLEAPG